MCNPCPRTVLLPMSPTVHPVPQAGRCTRALPEPTPEPRALPQLPCYAFSLSGGVAVCQDYLDLQETPKPPDLIKVNSRPVDHEELPPLLHDTPNAKRLAQDRRDGLGVGTRAADVQRFLRASEVWALIKNQLTRSVGELAKLQAAPRNNEKRIRLDQRFRRRWRKRAYLDPKTGQICYPRLHLDVSSHTHCRLDSMTSAK